MNKLTQLIGRPAGSTPTFIGRLDSRVTRLLDRISAFGLSKSVVVSGGGLLLMGLFGWINFHAVRGLNFDYLYLLCCALVGWAGGTRSALVCSVTASAVLSFCELVGGLTFSPWVAACNSLMRLLAFSSIGWLAAEMGRSTRALQQTVVRRTARLQHEVKEHTQTAELLSEATEIFKQLTEGIADVFWVTDPSKTQVEYVSPMFEEVWGRSRRSLYLLPGVWLEGIHPDDRERVSCAMVSKQIAGLYDEEYRVLRPDGSLRWVHDRAFPVRDQMGAVYRLVGIAEDITERKRTEQLLQAERDVGIALSSTSDLHVALDRLLEVAVQLEGISCGGIYLADAETGELTLKAHRGLSDPFAKRVSRYPIDATEASLVKRGQARYLRQDEIPRNQDVLWGGEGLKALALVPVQHRGTAIGQLNLGSYRYDEILPRTRIGIELIAAQVAGAIARIQAEESLRRNETQLRTIVNNAPIALLATDARGTITFEDGQAFRALGVRPGEHVRRPAEEVYRDFPAMQDNIRRALAGEQFNSVLEFDSTVFECRYTPLRDQDQHPAGLIAVATDVTERFRLQRQILEISDREQARLGQDIHDGLCQQLIGLAISANSLQQTLGADARPGAAMAQKICRLLDETITEARGVAQGLYPIRLTTEGLPPALEELAAGITQRHDIECRCEIADSLHSYDVPTATHLYRIAKEAVNNAVKYSGARQISIRLDESATAIKLEVKDNGKWIAPAGTSKSGMGMHIMNYRAQLIGGSLLCQGGEHGTVVTCCLDRSLANTSV